MVDGWRCPTMGKAARDFVDMVERPEAPGVIQIFDSEIAGTIRAEGPPWTLGAQTNVISGNLSHHFQRFDKKRHHRQMTGGNNVIARE
jgi:hypothetical protein